MHVENTVWKNELILMNKGSLHLGGGGGALRRFGYGSNTFKEKTDVLSKNNFVEGLKTMSVCSYAKMTMFRGPQAH